MRSVIPGALLLSLLSVVACSETKTETPNGGGSSSGGSSGTPAITPGEEIGKGDGSASSVTFAEIHTLTKTESLGDPEPVDLAFNPADPGELWVIGYGDDSTHVGYIDGDVAWKRYRDPAASHFMGSPVAISMGADGFWGTCGNTDNGQNEGLEGTDGTGNLFMGPAMFSVDRSIFATQNAQTKLGSHFDMLHQTPFCRGIAWETGNTYWAFNAYDSSIDKYNFNKPHEKGGDDHSDGEIYKYVEGQVKGAEDKVTPSHLVFDPSDNYLYIADTGNQRIVKLDTTKGSKTGPLPSDRRNEPLEDSGIMGGVDVEVVVDKGVLEKPSGIEIKNDLIYVTDAATSTFHVFKKDGTEVRKLNTDLPEGSLAGFTFGSDNKIWFTDRKGGRVLRIDPK
jgi:hypothetical protein